MKLWKYKEISWTPLQKWGRRFATVQEFSIVSNCWVQYLHWIERAFLSFGAQGHKCIFIIEGSWPHTQCPVGNEPGKLSFLAAERVVQEQTVTWVWVEQIDSEPLCTLSRHTAFIIIRRQERFEASRGPSGQTEPASRHVMEHYRFCSKLWKKPHIMRRHMDEENTT